MSQVLKLWRRDWRGYAFAIVAVVLVTACIAVLVPLMGIYPRSLPMLYLLAVVAAGALFGSSQAILAAVLAAVSFDWYFVGPPSTFLVASDLDEAVISLLLLATALVTGQLAAELRRRVQREERRERGAILLYDVVRLMSQSNLTGALAGAAQRLRQELRARAVRIELADGALEATETAGEWDAPTEADSRLLLIDHSPLLNRVGRWVRPVRRAAKAREMVDVVPVRFEEREVGKLLLLRQFDANEFSPADTRLLHAVAVQLGQSVERVRLQLEATEGEILRRSDDLKTALLNAVSHDLRTPLASILASAGSLLQDDVAWTEGDRREFAEGIRDEASRLNRIVENLLDLSRIEAGSLRPHKRWYDLRSLVDDVLERLRVLTAKHELIVEVPEEFSPVLVDPVAIDQVLSNLIENAAKYAPAGTEILIAARQGDAEAFVEVSDQGPGIPPDVLPQIFDPFFQVRRPHELDGSGSRLKGSGLGLAVARGLVQAHGGHIWAENRAEGGTRFVFTLQTPSSVGSAVLERQEK